MIRYARLALTVAVLSAALPALAATRVTMVTSQGTIVLELDEEKAPQTVANFVRYANEHFYDGTIFHRVIDNFMIQGGGYTPDMQQKDTHAPIPNEAKNGLKNLGGTIAMARTADPDSATAQFFINVRDNAFLDYPSRDGWGYCVFGKVVDGLEVVERIRQTPTGRVGPYTDVPAEPVVIRSVTVNP